MASLWLMLVLCLTISVSATPEKTIFEPRGHHDDKVIFKPKGHHDTHKRGHAHSPKGSHGIPDKTHVPPKGAGSTPKGPSATLKGKQGRPFFVFGDSLVDNGNNNFLITGARADMPPYGIDSPDHSPTGRFSNGLNIPDVISTIFLYFL